MKTHRKNPTAYGTSPCQGEVGRGQNNVQFHRELVLNGLEHPQTPHILYEDNKHILVDRYPENFLTTDYWTQRAIALLKQAKTKSINFGFWILDFGEAARSSPLALAQRKACGMATLRDATRTLRASPRASGGFPHE
ncbi:hypothetical protein [Nostoc sp.]|uniref:hypothetical protein n=1 Tax=Nostoc sp. TaxID=1180 RepID=UPI002FFD0A44